MPTVKLQGPANFGGFSHAGESFVPDEEGIIEVPAHLPSDVIASHGLKPVEAKKGPKKLEPLAKSAKDGVSDETADAGDKLPDSESVKPAQKGAKSAKVGEQ